MEQQKKIDPKREYKLSEVARPYATFNPNGLGLIALGYLSLYNRARSGKLKVRKDKHGKKTFYFMMGQDILDYLKGNG